ncbi:hypothetical protein B0H67DRAFT_566105 [Lasiosphaeris hirsuta]|uniref:Rhodopsin domain-containing protein n=1 Tax=Lasiosphaeris hirsuta TaxID=260670 RepID=A0AA40E886_9PEZI|nr:hypothetical protein B0H67DRAFT_566105 [Lasiosphaeris hirsuta]
MTESNQLSTSIVLASSISPLFAILFVGLRFYTAKVILRSIHKDDWLIFVALVFSVGYSVTEIIHTQYGLGLHKAEIDNIVETYRMYMMITGFPVNIFSNLSILFTKASILAFYLRFSISRAFVIAVYAVLVVVVGYCLAGAVAVLYACQPISKYWTFGPGHCIEANSLSASLVSLNVFTDAVILVLPFWLLRPLRTGLVQRVAIATVLGTGGFILAVSIWRLFVNIETFGDKELTYKYGINYLWLIIETNVAIVCACLPTLRALVGRAMSCQLVTTHRPEPMRLDTISNPRVSTDDPALALEKRSNPSTLPSTAEIGSSRNSMFSGLHRARSEDVGYAR